MGIFEGFKGFTRGVSKVFQVVSGDFSRIHGSSMKSQVAFLGYTRGFRSQGISKSFQGCSSGSQLASEDFKDHSEGFRGCPRAFPRYSIVCLKVFQRVS